MNLKGKRILVTGGGGFIASHLVKRLVARGESQVFVLTKYNSVVENVRLAGVWKDITPIEADLRNVDSLNQLKSVKPEVIFHFAAYNHVGDSFIHIQESLMSNAVGSANLLESYQGFDRFVYLATSEVYGFQQEVPFVEDQVPFPISPYAIGKYAGELYGRMLHHVKKLPITCVRPFNTFGPYQSDRAVIAEVIQRCLRNEPFRATEGKQTREFNYVENVIDAIELAAETDSLIGETWNIGSGDEISIRDLITKVKWMTQSDSELFFGALPYRPTEIWRMASDSTRFRQKTGWAPAISFEEGLRRTIEWTRRFNDLYGNVDSPLARL